MGARDAFSPPDYCPLHAYPAFSLYSPLKRNQSNTLITHFDPDAVFLLLDNAERVLKNVKASNFGEDSDDFRDPLKCKCHPAPVSFTKSTTETLKKLSGKSDQSLKKTSGSSTGLKNLSGGKKLMLSRSTSSGDQKKNKKEDKKKKNKDDK